MKPKCPKCEEDISLPQTWQIHTMQGPALLVFCERCGCTLGVVKSTT